VFPKEKFMKTSKLEWTFLGSGSAFCLENWQSNILVGSYTKSHNAGEDSETPKRLLIDCGGDVRHGLHDLGLTYADINAVYISHLHQDHIGGMEGLMFTTYFNPTVDRPLLFIHQDLIEGLWEALKPGVDCIEGVEVTLDTFFNVNVLTDDGMFNFGGTNYNVVQTVHVMGNRKVRPSYGLEFRTPSGELVFFTSDTQFAPHQILHFLERADIIFHDCETGFESNVHTHYNKIITYPDEVKAKIHPYHYQDNPQQDPVADGMNPFVQKSQLFQWSAVPSQV